MTNFTFVPAALETAMRNAGFVLVNMGGNVTAWRKDISPDQHVLITCGEDGQDTIGDPDKAEWLACSYFHDRPESAVGDDNGPVTLAQAIAWTEAL